MSEASSLLGTGILTVMRSKSIHTCKVLTMVSGKVNTTYVLPWDPDGAESCGEEAVELEDPY